MPYSGFTERTVVSVEMEESDGAVKVMAVVCLYWCFDYLMCRGTRVGEEKQYLCI